MAIKITNELLYDNAFNLESYILDQFGKALANTEEDAFLNGDGKGKPLGLFAETGGGQATAVTSGANISADDIISLVYTLKRPYRQNAKFILNDQTISSIRKLKDNNGAYMKKNVENIATSIPTTFQAAGDAVGEVNTRFHLTGKSLESVSAQFVKFADINNADVTDSVRGAQMVMSAFGLKTKDTGSLLGVFTSVSQKTGVSVTDLMNSLVQNGATFRDMGLSAQNAATLLGNFEAAGIDSNTAMGSLKKAMERPDGNEGGGFAGETCAISEVSGEGEITIGADDLMNQLDDGASYTLIVTVKDSLGQSANASENFEVHWAHQAEIPGGTAVPNKDSLITVITPAAPASYAEGDVCDIYRLSADGPELIIYGGAFGTSYVDPYPAFGEGCGHRIVDRTVNGDYIAADDLAACP